MTASATAAPPWLAADPGCRLLECDFSGIEAVLTGWFSEAPQYIRLATMGVHAYLTSHVAGVGAELSWSDADLTSYLADIKKRYSADNAYAHPNLYDPCKTLVHGANYLRTAFGFARDLPHLFPSKLAAERIYDIYMSVCPKLHPWQQRTLAVADETHFLGGATRTGTTRAGYQPQPHPFAYTHWFWGVKSYRPISEGLEARYAALRRHKRRTPDVVRFHDRPFKVELGDDAKRAVAFYPQSTAAGILFEAILALFRPGSPEYIGDAFYGRSPLRAPIHDSLLLEIPVRVWDRVVERVARAMRRQIRQLPIPLAWRHEVATLGEYLSIGVEAKAGATGGSWGRMEKLPLPQALAADLTPLAEVDAHGLVADAWQYAAAESEWDEDVVDLSRGVSLAAMQTTMRAVDAALDGVGAPLRVM